MVDGGPPNDIMATSVRAYNAFWNRHLDSNVGPCHSPSPTAPPGAPCGNPVTPTPGLPSRHPPYLGQTNIPESPGYDPTHERDGDDPAPFGCGSSHHAPSGCIVLGPIVSPCHSDRAMHARTLGASRFDIIKLACAHDHSEMDGIPSLDNASIQKCGYGHVKHSVEDVVICFKDIILVHKRVCKL